jgi:hypothetical protein
MAERISTCCVNGYWLGKLGLPHGKCGRTEIVRLNSTLSIVRLGVGRRWSISYCRYVSFMVASPDWKQVQARKGIPELAHISFQYIVSVRSSKLGWHSTLADPKRDIDDRCVSDGRHEHRVRILSYSSASRASCRSNATARSGSI